MDALFYNNIVFTILLMSGYTLSTESDYYSQLHKRNLNPIGIQKRRVFDPVDSIKFMIGGVNNQYSKDYSFGTNSFNPNKFAYMYSGNMVSGNGRSFIPSFSSSGMFQDSPNYQKTNTNDAKNTKSPTDIKPELPESFNKKQSFGNVDAVTPTLSTPYVVPTSPAFLEPEIIPQLMIEQMPEGSLANVNMTNIFLKSPYRGQPGMLGYGAQIPVPQPQIVTTNYTSVKQEHIPEPALSEYSGALNRVHNILNIDGGSESRYTYNQNKDALKQDLSMYENIKPLDDFVVLNPFDNVMHKEIDDNDTETSVGYQNSQQNRFQFIKPITTGYDWHGEWPGHSDSTEDKGWSDGWGKSWERPTSTKTGEKPETANRVFVPISHSDNDTDFGDGPEVQEISNKDRIDGMQSALNVFQQFLSFLRITNLPVGSDQKTSTNNDLDYNEMAKSWAKDVHA